jgi:hypothetical protein
VSGGEGGLRPALGVAGTGFVGSSVIAGRVTHSYRSECLREHLPSGATYTQNVSQAVVATVGEPDSTEVESLPVHRRASADGRIVGMPRAAVVVVLALHSDGPMAYRYTSDGTFAGDTRHESTEAAMSALVHEYGSALSEWQSAPEGQDATEFALSLVRRTC